MADLIDANWFHRRRSARFAALLLALHGLLEVSGPFLAASLSQSLESFGGLGKAEIGPNAIAITLFGLIWGLGRLVAAWGIWRLRKWAVALGLVISLATVITALSIIPAGVTDTLLAVPTLILLLQAWFGYGQVTQ
jgi:hypothetical protein